jgi:hypothetical protein
MPDRALQLLLAGALTASALVLARSLVASLAAAVLAMDRWPDLAHAGGNRGVCSDLRCHRSVKGGGPV